MSGITYNVKITGVEELRKALEGHRYKMAVRTAVAINKTGKKAVRVASDAMKTVLPVPVGILKKTVGMKSKASHNRTRARLNLWFGYPIPLRYFRAAQTKKGVTYLRSRADKGRMIATDAFIIRKGGAVYRRAGSERGPLVEVFGPSPGDAMVVTGVRQKCYEFIMKQLPIEIKEQVRQVMLANSGIIKFKRG